jgi:hypothetical protein
MNIEEKLWNYIDGACTPEEQQAISRLIEQDEVYRRKYQELLQLNQEFAGIELDEPPMAFTYNVMETIRAEHAQNPLKAAIDKRIIRGISIFFGFTISVLLIIALSSIHWSAMGSAGPAFKFTMPNIAQYFTGNFMKGFMFFDVVLALFLFDGYLRKKTATKAQISVQSGRQQTEHHD